MKLASLIAASMLLGVVVPAHGQQFRTDADIDTPNGDSNRYIGTDPDFGEASDSGRDAFDGYGVITNLRGLSLLRRSEVFVDMNLYRFFDTFTNNTGRRISTTVNFFGDLGSDGSTVEILSEDGLAVSCEMDFDVACVGGDPVIAHVFSNIGVGLAAIGADDDEDQYNALFRVVLDPGQSASLLNFAFLASEEDADTTQADIDLAIARGRELQSAPFVGGLTAAQRAQIINFDVTNGVGGVPEPATWGLMIAGVGMIGGALRTRRRTVPATA